MIDKDLTEKERAEIELLAQNSVALNKMFQAYLLFTEENMMLKLKYTLLRALDTLNDDVDKVASGNNLDLVILNGEDKIFDRIWKMLTETDKLASVLELSKDGFLPKAAKGKNGKAKEAQQVAL